MLAIDSDIIELVLLAIYLEIIITSSAKYGRSRIFLYTYDTDVSFKNGL